MLAVRRRLFARLIVACGALFAMVVVGGGPARAQTALPTLSMSFGAASIDIGASTSLNFTIAVTSVGADTVSSNVNFADALPSGLVVATPNGLNIPDNSGTGCNGATVTAAAGSGAISFAASSLIAGNTCTFFVNVTATSVGTKNNATTIASSGGGNTATASLVVNQTSSTTTLVSSQNPSAFGQAVTFTATVTGASPTGTVTFKDGTATLGTGTLNGAGQAIFTTTSLTVGSHTITAAYAGDTNNAASASATISQAVGTALDSLKLKALQNQITPIVAQTSGAAISGAIDGAIADAFGAGGNPVKVGPSGIAINFADEPRSAVARRTDDAFAALGHADSPKKAPPQSAAREWSLWLDVHGTGWDRSDANADLKGRQVNVTGGLGRKLTPDFLVGIVAGYENFKYDSVSLNGTIKGNGGTVGGYAAWRFAPTLRWDVAVAWSNIAYDGNAGTANGSFTGQRWLTSTGVTGSYRVSALVIEPSVKVYALWERQGEWTDSLGTRQAAHSFSVGRVASGGKVIYPWLLASGATLSPYAGLYGDWRFGTDDAVPAGQPVVGIGAGWSGRATGGVSYTAPTGGMLSVGVEYGGLGADYKVWTASARGSLPF